ncbi:MAG: phenylacetate--CoA ligase family protein [Candidatus Eisenbacteria bacterium]
MWDLFALLSRTLFYPALVALKRESHLRHLAELECTQFLEPEKLALLQYERLKTMLTHAYKHCPFYARRFGEWGVRPEHLGDLTDLQRFPVLTKSDIQANLPELVASEFPRSELIENRTGGSTGKPLVFYVDRERMETRKAATFRHNRWAGYDIADKAGAIWGAPGDLARGETGGWRSLVSERILVLDASSLSGESMQEFAGRLSRFGPKAILAYANSAYLFASFLAGRSTEKEGAGPPLHPRSVITTAEMLFPHQRDTIERVFGCPVFDRYGARETSVIASECERHSGLHVNAENLYLEIVIDPRSGKPAPPGESGDVVITDLSNVGMPLIRYAIEDRGRLATELCSCGRTLPLLESLEGRVTDFIKTPDGRHVSGAALTIKLIAEIRGIGQAQLVQEQLDAVRFRVVKGSGYSPATEATLKQKALEFLGPEMRVSLECVEDIPREPSGKFRFSISLV